MGVKVVYFVFDGKGYSMCRVWISLFLSFVMILLLCIFVKYGGVSWLEFCGEGYEELVWCNWIGWIVVCCWFDWKVWYVFNIVQVGDV